MKRIFDDAVNPSIAADLQAKALEQKILMASKGVDGDDSVAGGHRTKTPSATYKGMHSGKKKSDDTYFDIITLQRQIQRDLDAMFDDLDRMSEDLHRIDLRMAERQADIDFILQNIHDADDLTDASGNRNARVQALLKKHGKEHLSDEDAYVFITGTLTQQLMDEQTVDQTARDDLKDKIDATQQAIQDRIQDGRDLGMDMTEYERQEARTMDFVKASNETAQTVVEGLNNERIEQSEDIDSFDFLLTENPSL